jgi:hypothetical protein
MTTPQQRDNRRYQFLTLESAARWRRNAANFRKYNRPDASRAPCATPARRCSNQNSFGSTLPCHG